MSLMSLCLLIDIILCICTIYQLQLHNNYISISKSFKNLTITTMLAYTFCTIGDITQVIIRYKYFLTSQDWSTSEAYLAGAKDLIYYIGNFTFFLLLFMRIKTSFQLSKYIMSYLTVLLTISVVFSFSYCFFCFYSAGKSGILLNSLLSIAIYPLSTSDFILNLSLFILFIYKIKNKDTMEGVEVADDVLDDISSDYNSDKKAIWNVMIKHCVLFGIALLSNQAWYIEVIVDCLSTTQTNFPTELIRDYTVRSVENVTNIIILWLVLKVNNGKYVSLCKCWHSCILEYCMKEDPDIIREGFVVNDTNEKMLLVGNNSDRSLLQRELNEKYGVEGNNLIVTQDIHDEDSKKISMQNMMKRHVEGHNVLMTQK